MITPIGQTTLSIPTYQTEDLVLRAPRMSDMPAYLEFSLSDRSKGVGGPFNEARTETRMANLIGHWHLHGYGRWMVADAATDAPLGVVGLMNPPDWPEPEIAWTVFAAAEGRSVAYRAAKFARRYAYEVLGWSTVISCTLPDNTRSIALAQRLGATRDGTHAHPEYGDMYIWRHLPPEAL